MREVKSPPQSRMSRFGSFLDSAILAVAPGWGAKRQAARYRLQMQNRFVRRAEKKLRAWEAADSDRFRGGKWLASRLSPDSELEEDLQTLWDRSKDLYKNDPFASGAIKGRVDNVVGCGIRLQARVIEAAGIIDDATAQVINTKLEVAHGKWAKLERLYAKQRLLERCRGIFGEALLIMSDRGTAEKPVPLAIQIIDPQRLETPPEHAGNPSVRMGIEFNPKTGMPVAYYIRNSHPGDTKDLNLTYERVPADRVCHVFEEELPEQHRGVPWLAPAMTDLKDAKDFKEAHLISEQVAACSTVFIKTADPEGTAAKNRDAGDLEEMSPGMAHYLRENEDVTFADPARPGNTLGPYIEWILRGVASAIRYPFELLTKKFENNFSGGRLSLIDGRISFRVWQQTSIEDCWERVYERFVKECVIVGVVGEIDPEKYLENPNVFSKHAWIPPGWPWVDPVKDVKSDKDAIDANLSTEATSCSARGEDGDEVKAQRLREKLQDVEVEAKVVERRRKLGLPDYPPQDVPPAAPESESQKPNGKPPAKNTKPAKVAA